MNDNYICEGNQVIDLTTGEIINLEKIGIALEQQALKQILLS